MSTASNVGSRWISGLGPAIDGLSAHSPVIGISLWEGEQRTAWSRNIMVVPEESDGVKSQCVV